MSSSAAETNATNAVDATPNDKMLKQDVILDQTMVEPIAIIGLSVKFPQDADSPEAFWQLLLEGRSAMTEVPADRFTIDSFYHENAQRLDTVHQYLDAHRYIITDAHNIL